MPQGFSRLEQGAGGKMGVSIYLERRCSYNRKVLFRPPQLSAVLFRVGVSPIFYL